MLIRGIRKVRAKVNQLLQRLRVSKLSESPALEEFWRSHGSDWAREEAEYADIAFIGGLAERVESLPRDRAIRETVEALKTVWRDGFSSPEDALSWNEMNDRLPDSAILAFVEGVALVWREVKEKV
ncbi:MAG: hypothetical protein AAFW68_02835 [Pseudomonadota bacterium]